MRKDSVLLSYYYDKLPKKALGGGIDAPLRNGNNKGAMNGFQLNQKKEGGWLSKYPDGGLTFLEPNSKKLPQGYKVPYSAPSSELAASIDGENGEPAYLIPTFKYGHPLTNPLQEFRSSHDYLGGPFKTWQEADEWDKNIRHPYVEKGQPIPTPLKRVGQDYNQANFKQGGTINTWLDKYPEGGSFSLDKILPPAKSEPLVRGDISSSFNIQKDPNLINVDPIGRQKKQDIDNVNQIAKIVEDRKKRIAASTKVNSTKNILNMSPQDWTTSAEALPDELRGSIYPNAVDDSPLNPLKWIGEMGSSLGQAPLKAQQQASNLPYLQAAIEPVLGGALGRLTEELPLMSKNVLKDTNQNSVYNKEALNEEVPSQPKLTILPKGANYLKNELEPKNLITDNDIQKIKNEEYNWTNSPEYLKRRKAITGESEKDIKEAVDKYKSWLDDDTKFISGKLEEQVLGNYSIPIKGGGIQRTISLSENSPRDVALGSLEHEIMHANSEKAALGNYSNYPVLKVGNPIKNLFNEYNRYLNKPFEQQVRQQKLLKYLEESQGIPRGTKLTSENLNDFFTQTQDAKIPPLKWLTHYGDVEAWLNKIPSSKRGKLLDVLNKSYAAAPIAGAATIATNQEVTEQQQKFGGQTNNWLNNYINVN